jgi:hypothetical protein
MIDDFEYAFSCINLCVGFGDEAQGFQSPSPPSSSSPTSVAVDHEEVESSLQSARKMREKAAAGSCYICFEGNPNIASLCCGHAVHLNCLSKWLETHTTCPQCRATMPKQHYRGVEKGVSNSSDINIDSDVADQTVAARISSIRGHSYSHSWVERGGQFVGLVRSPTPHPAVMNDFYFDDFSLDSLGTLGDYQPDSSTRQMLDSEEESI